MENSMAADAAQTQDPAPLGRMRNIRAAIGWKFVGAGNALIAIGKRIAPEDVSTTSELIEDWYYLGHRMGRQEGIKETLRFSTGAGGAS